MRVLFLLFFSSALFADSLAVSSTSMSMSYAEYSPSDELLDTERSKSLVGVEFDYSFDFLCGYDRCSFFNVHIGSFGGQTDYVGSLLGSGSGYGSFRSTTFNLLYDLDSELLHNQKFSFLDLYYGAGLGYHFWYRELSPTQIEEYSWFYVSGIVGLEKTLLQELSIGCFMRYKYGLNPIMTTNFISEPFKLGSANNFEVSVPLAYSLSERLDMLFTYTYVRQNIAKSNEIVKGSYVYYEPKSISNDNYFKFGMRFKY